MTKLNRWGIKGLVIVPEEPWNDPSKIFNAATKFCNWENKFEGVGGGELAIQSMNSIAGSIEHPVFCHVMACACLKQDPLCQTPALQLVETDLEARAGKPSGDFMLIQCSISSQDGIKGLFDKVHSKVWNNQNGALSLVSPANGVSGGGGEAAFLNFHYKRLYHLQKRF